VAIILNRGAVEGSISFGLNGSWYGPAGEFNATIAPYMAVMPPPNSTNLTPGSYIDSVALIAGGTLDTKLAPDGSYTFYCKSLTTPEDIPMSSKAISAFMTYLAHEAFASNLVGASLSQNIFMLRISHCFCVFEV